MIDSDKATDKLQRQVDLITQLRDKMPFSSAYKKWRRDTEIAIEHIFGSTDRHLPDFAAINNGLRVSNSTAPDYQSEKAFKKTLDIAREILTSMIEEIRDWGIQPSGTFGSQLEAAVVIENLCRRFHLVARQMRNRYNERPTIEVEDEYDVQDLLHSILNLYFDDIRPEEWTPSYGGSSSRMDFLLKAEQVVIETKKTRKGLGPKEIGEELIIDIEKYRGHPNCGTLICFVYDPEGRIPHPKGIENDLNRTDSDLTVRVFISPSGL